MSLHDVLPHIDTNGSRYLGYLKELVHQPSISTENTGVKRCADLVREMMDQIGLTTRIFQTKGNPIVYGAYRSPTPCGTILFYNHYDVQHPGPLNEWASGPFEPEIRDGKIYGRGTADNKGTFASRIAALHSILTVIGECPVNIKFIVEGEEEIGSPNLAPFVTEQRQLLEADSVIWEGSERDTSERPTIELGNKGMLCVDLHATGARSDAHSGKAPLLCNPAWRIVWALASIKLSDGKIRIDGFYDDIRRPTQLMERLLEILPFDVQREKLLAGIEQIPLDENPENIKKRLFFDPTCNIDSIRSGYEGEGPKTIVPSKAFSKIDMRLVPDQDPEDILHKLQVHLTKFGFDDIEIRPLMKFYPARTDPESGIVRLTIETAKSVYGIDPVVYPNSIASGAMYVPVKIMKKPTVQIGAGYYGSNIHAPNENIRVQDFLLAIKHVVSILLCYK